MRQRLSSEPDRYRGRRRIPTPPRSRYAVVVTSAFVGAGIVALGAATNLPDAKAVSPSVLQGLETASLTKDGVAARDADTERASRSDDRDDKTSKGIAPRGKTAKDGAASGAVGGNAEGTADLVPLAGTDEAATDVWVLPLDDYTFTSPFGMRFGELHAGIDLAAVEGTPYKAVHGGVVKSAGYSGGYGYAVTVQHTDGTETTYGHSRKLLVRTGQVVKTGDILGEVGATGYAFGSHLHIEIHVKGDPNPTDPVPVLRAHGVDIKLAMETIYSNLAAS